MSLDVALALAGNCVDSAGIREFVLLALAAGSRPVGAIVRDVVEKLIAVGARRHCVSRTRCVRVMLEQAILVNVRKSRSESESWNGADAPQDIRHAWHLETIDSP